MTKNLRFPATTKYGTTVIGGVLRRTLPSYGDVRATAVLNTRASWVPGASFTVTGSGTVEGLNVTKYAITFP